jgi:transcriptional regulator with GAF, ATPase, and Fis domain
MDHLRLAVGVWREVGRHADLPATTLAIVQTLTGALPIANLLIRRVDVSQFLIRTVAHWEADSDGAPAEAITACSAADGKRLVAWSTRGGILRRGRRIKKTGELAAIPAGLTGDVAMGPLTGESGLSGVLVMAARPRVVFNDKHINLIESILEPFAVALENDRRLHELTTLREAAEADRRSLLTRLGRTEMTDVIVGADVGLRSVMDRIALVAHSDVPVLILGETGTGKEVIARSLHNRSGRSGGPFIRVNCGAIPPELIDSQLFGHERGSFTGASDTRQGWFERADGGTLFLDEIGELPLPAQVRFLRVLQDGFVERVGGHQPKHVDVRVVAATHQDLAAMVRDGRFREDLWYRIAVFPVELPPLRDRLEDIPALARHFAERAATRFGLAPAMPTYADLRILMQYDWPGNIRELGAVIDRAALLGEGKSLEIAKSLGVAPVSRVRSGEVTLRSDSKSDGKSTGPWPLDDAIRQHIIAALKATRGRIEGPNGAAVMLSRGVHSGTRTIRGTNIANGDAPRAASA